MAEQVSSKTEVAAPRRSVVRAMFTQAELEKFESFNRRTGAVHTAREILLAASDIAAQLGDEQTAAALEELIDHDRARELYPL